MDAAAAAPMFIFFSVSVVCSSAMLPLPVNQMKLQLQQLQWRQGFATFVPSEFNAPTDTTGPGTVTIPPAAPATFAPTTPSVPVTNPVTTPSTNVPGGQPGTNPVMPPSPSGGLPGTTPTVAPPVDSNVPPAGGSAPAAPGQSWCVAKNGVPETSLQVALDYACGIGGADCSAIQQGANCYNPNTLQNHASFAFNSYYQKNPGPTSCDFGGVATISNANPSTGSCVFPTSSSSSSSPGMTNPAPTPPASSTDPTTTSPGMMNPPPTDPTMGGMNPPPTNPAMGMNPPPTDASTTSPTGPTPPTSSSTEATPTSTSSGISPNILNASSPDMGGAPAGVSNASASVRPFSGCIVAAISIIAWRMMTIVNI